MNQNKNNLKNNKEKISHSNPEQIICDTCENCSNIECNCSCHFQKKSIDNIPEDIDFHSQYEEILNSDSLTDQNNTNDNNNYDKNICKNLGTNVQNNIEKKKGIIKTPKIDIDLSKNLNDLSQYYRNIYTKTKLELDVEKEKNNSLEKIKDMNKDKVKDLLKDKNILLEKVKNLSEQLDRVIYAS